MKRAYGTAAIVVATLVALSPVGEASEMSQEQASAFARLALKGVRKEYPEQAGRRPQRRDGRPDAAGAAPRLLRLLRLALVGPRPLDAGAAAAAVPGPAGAEADPRRPGRAPDGEEPAGRGRLLRPAERASRSSGTYGWAWLLKLAEELHGWDDPDGREWSKNLQAAGRHIVARYLAFLPEADLSDPQRRPSEHGVRAGVRPRLRPGRGRQARCANWSRSAAGPISARTPGFRRAWEPDGADFFSPSLMEADLMRRVLPPAEFRAWFRRFLPDLAKGEPKNLLEPAKVTDRTDPQIVHLDGLNLSRAWCMRGIAAALPEGRSGPQGAGRSRPPATPRRRWATSPAATTPASTGWRRSPCTCSRRRRRISPRRQAREETPLLGAAGLTPLFALKSVPRWARRRRAAAWAGR